jgi:hypothetical protein
LVGNALQIGAAQAANDAGTRQVEWHTTGKRIRGSFMEGKMTIGGLTLFSRHSDGGRGLASYHPRSSQTWHWSVSIDRQAGTGRASRRSGQWHDFYRLPFGFRLVVSWQDYHKEKPA